MLKLVSKRCKGCGICANFCPKKVLEITEVGKCAIIPGKEPTASSAASVNCAARTTPSSWKKTSEKE